eukprot:388873_1
MLHKLARRSLFCNIKPSHNLWTQNIHYFTTDTEESNEPRAPQQSQEDLTAMFTQIHSRKVDKTSTRKPAYPYDTILSIETPSLLLNMKQLETNMKSMNTFIDTNKLKLRPNTNIHKSSDMIQLQLKMHNDNIKRMNGITCSTINESELLMTSPTNFLSPNTEYKIRDILLSNICIDLPKMWRYVQLFDNTSIVGIKLSTFIDDIFQIHLWNYTMEELKKTNQNILNRHTSSSADGAMHQSSHLKLGVMLVLKSTNDQIGININNKDDIDNLKEILNIMGGDYRNNLYLRGFYMDSNDEIAKNWLLNTTNQKDICIDNYFDKLYIGNVNEIYNDKYIFDNCGLVLLSTITNIYYEENKFIHLLDCGYNSYSNIPLGIGKYHRP